MLEIDGEWTCIYCWESEINEQAKGDKEISGRAEGSQETMATKDQARVYGDKREYLPGTKT